MRITKNTSTIFGLLIFLSLLGCAVQAPVRTATDQSTIRNKYSASTRADTRLRREEAKGWLGVSIQDVTVETAKNLNLKRPSGALIVEAIEDGPAAKAGLKNGDVITAVNGRTINNALTLSMIIANFRKGEHVVIRAFQNGRERTFSVTIEGSNEKTIGTAVRDSRSATVGQEPAQGKQAPPNQKAKAEGTNNISRLSVFNFNAVNIDASKYGPEVTNLLSDALGKNPAFSIISRHDLQEFLGINNLQQNDNLRDMVSIGGRLGLNFIITGRIEKKGMILAIEFIVVSLHDEKIIFTRKVQVAGDANLAAEVIKMSDSIAAAVMAGAH